MSTKNFQHAIIQSVVEESPTAKTFIFCPEKNFSYQAGQFITLLFRSAITGISPERRAYSFSSAPGVDAFPAITVQRIPNGYGSRQLIDHFKEGDTIIFSHVSGKFILPENSHLFNHLFFFAAGSGIVPIISLIKAAISQYPQLKITLIYSSHSRQDALFYETLKKISIQYAHRFSIEWIFSVGQEKTHTRLSHFLLLQLLKKYQSEPIEKNLFYTCGPYEYMDMISIILRTEGIEAKNIRQEYFYIPRGDRPPEPEDKSGQEIEFHLGDKIFRYQSQYPDSILSSGLQNGLPLNFSCRSGQCGSCTAKCLSGNVWMQYNEVLTEAEVAEGYILTCCGFPIGGPVVLEK